MIDLPPDRMGPMVPADAAVGYKYWHLSIYWCNVWTSPGEYVLYSEAGKRFQPLGNDLDAVARHLDAMPRFADVMKRFRL